MFAKCSRTSPEQAREGPARAMCGLERGEFVAGRVHRCIAQTWRRLSRLQKAPQPGWMLAVALSGTLCPSAGQTVCRVEITPSPEKAADPSCHDTTLAIAEDGSKPTASQEAEACSEENPDSVAAAVARPYRWKSRAPGSDRGIPSSAYHLPTVHPLDR